MSDELAIRARGLTKRYRLYRKPLHRFLDTYGLLWRGSAKFTEHAALAGLSFDVQRGEKIAIIGRNGAGKSTLLKILCGVVSPTAGEIGVNGEIHALLSLGTGFHPDFTGRDNVFSYLAHLGITGPAAQRAFTQIVDFAELEEYIDQPVKTYSAGMGVRLMFSTATVLTPDILVIDEVLGAGDAYFSKKSFERMRELCEHSRTTLLLVTHDLYSAAMFCERFIWIDRGAIKMDGPSQSVLRAYEESIKQQEEQRLRQRRIAMLEANALDAGAPLADLLPAYFRVESTDRRQFELAISDLAFFSGDKKIASIEMDASETARENAGAELVLDGKEGNWGPLETVHERPARRLLTYGSIFHKLPLVLTSPEIRQAVESGTLRVEATCWTDQECVLEFAVMDRSGVVIAASRAPAAAGGWAACRLAIAAATTDIAFAETGKARYGNRFLEITDVDFLDANGNRCLQYGVGAEMRIQLRYRINDPNFHERPTILAAFQQNGLIRAHRFWTDQILLSAQDRREGTLEIVASPLLLGAGTYFVTVTAYREGYIQSPAPKTFFTASNDIYDMHARAYEILIRPATGVPFCNDVIFQHPSVWLLDGTVVARAMPYVARDRDAGEAAPLSRDFQTAKAG